MGGGGGGRRGALFLLYIIHISELSFIGVFSRSSSLAARFDLRRENNPCATENLLTLFVSGFLVKMAG